ETRPAGPAKARMQKKLRGRMVELVCVQRSHDRYIIRDLRQVRQQLGNFRPAPAVKFEIESRGGDVRMPAQEGEALALDKLLRTRLAVELQKFRLVVE